MSSPTRRPIFLAAVIGLVTCAVYLPALGDGFAGDWDDNGYVVQNPHLKALDLGLVRWSFTAFHMSNWHPLTWLSHALDRAVWGLDPRGHHLTNVLLHGLDTALVVMLAAALVLRWRRRAQPDLTGADPGVLVAAGVAGLLFGLHPVHVESVAWVAERKDLLCALFYLGSLLAWLQPTRAMRLASLGLFALALLSKPMAVTLPLVLLVLDACPLERLRTLREVRAALVEKLPFFALSAGASVLTVLAQRAGGSVVSIASQPLGSRVLVAARALAGYVGLMLWPADLVALHPYPEPLRAHALEFAASLGFVAALGASCIWLARRRPWWTAAWASYAIMLLPVLGLVQVGRQAMAERYTYLPSVGPFVLAGVGVAWLVNASGTRGRTLVAAGALAVLIALTVRTSAQLEVWQSAVTLWDHTIASGADSALARNNRGAALNALGKLDDAQADFERALAMDPRYSRAWFNLGSVQAHRGQPQEAIESFGKAIAIEPGAAEFHTNLGTALFLAGEHERALESYSKALELAPDDGGAWFIRGKAWLTTGQRERALADFRRACALGIAQACAPPPPGR